MKWQFYPSAKNGGFLRYSRMYVHKNTLVVVFMISEAFLDAGISKLKVIDAKGFMPNIDTKT